MAHLASDRERERGYLSAAAMPREQRRLSKHGADRPLLQIQSARYRTNGPDMLSYQLEEQGRSPGQRGRVAGCVRTRGACQARWSNANRRQGADTTSYPYSTLHGFGWGSIAAKACLAKEQFCEQNLMPQRVVKSPNDARAASKEGVMRYVLAGSLALVVILFILGYIIS